MPINDASNQPSALVVEDERARAVPVRTRTVDVFMSRLRRILAKRHRRNPKRLPRAIRWPNQYFHELGLYSLNKAHTRLVQSTRTY